MGQPTLVPSAVVFPPKQLFVTSGSVETRDAVCLKFRFSPRVKMAKLNLDGTRSRLGEGSYPLTDAGAV